MLKYLMGFVVLMSRGVFSLLLMLSFLLIFSGMMLFFVFSAFFGPYALYAPWSGQLILLGVFLMLLTVFLAYIVGVIRPEQVVESWSVFVDEASGRGDEVFNDIEGLIKESRAPNLSVERREIAPGILRGYVLGGKRKFLVVRDSKNLKLAPFQLFISARDYGRKLHVSWYLTYRIGLIRAVLSLIPGLSFIPRLISDLDLFDLQDLTAYVTNTHHCTLDAVSKLMLRLNQDPKNIDRKTRGFLGIS